MPSAPRIPTPATRARSLRWRRWLLLAGVGALASLAGLGCAVSCQPAWYRPASIDYNLLDRDKADLARLLDRIGVALNRREAVEIELHEDQLNRWIAERHEWPEADRIDLGALKEPYACVLDGGRIRVAARVAYRELSVVASVTASPRILGDRLRIDANAVHAGVAPVPVRLVRDWLRGGLPPAYAAFLTADGAWLCANDFVWPNGRVRFRLAHIESDRSLLRLRLEPL